MASPVKAFIDPTFIHRNSIIISNTNSIGSIENFSKYVISSIIKEKDYRLQIVDFKIFPIVLNDNVKPKIPPPPMGRQTLLTFPPIYLEATLWDRGRPQEGLIYPRN